MEKNQVAKRVIEIVQGSLTNLSGCKADITGFKTAYKRNAVVVGKSSNLKNDLGLDSLDIIELAQQIEDKFNIPRLKDEVVEHWGTIDDITVSLQPILAKY